MNASSESYISHNMIIQEVAKRSGDPEYKYESEGYYMSLVQEALAELSFDTLFLEVSKTFELNGCSQLTLPSGFFNIKQVYGFSGNECTINNRKNIYWKRNYRNGASRDDWQNSNDPFHKRRGSKNTPTGLYYFGLVNGVMHLSPNCSGFEKILVTANGLIADIGDDPIVPMFFRQAVVDYAVVESLSIRIATFVTDPAVNIWQAVLNRHEGRLTKPYTGSWENARYRAKNLDNKIREDIHEYMSKLDY